MRPVIKILTLSAVVLFFSCSDETSNTSENNQLKVDYVLKDSLPVEKKDSPKTEPSADTSVSNLKKHPPQIYNGPQPEVWGTVYYNSSNCGKTKPENDVPDTLSKYMPLYSSVIILKNKTGSYKIKTDAKGGFSEPVPVGTYSVFLTGEVNKNIHSMKPEDYEDCLVQKLTQVTIRSNKNNNIYITFPCAPGDKL